MRIRNQVRSSQGVSQNILPWFAYLKFRHFYVNCHPGFKKMKKRQKFPAFGFCLRFEIIFKR